MRHRARWLALLAFIFVLPIALRPFGAAQAQVPKPTSTITFTAFQFTVSQTSTGAALSTATNAPGSTTYVRQVMIQPLTGNTSGSVEVRSSASQSGYQLSTGQQVVIPCWGNLSGILIKVNTANDGVCVTTWTD